MSKWLHALSMMMLSLVLAACSMAPQHVRISSDVDALATSDAQSKRRFVILPGNKDLPEQDLQFIEFKAYLEKVLAKRGFTKVDTLQNGDVVLFLAYDVSGPQAYQYSYEVPVWNNMGVYPYSRRYLYYSTMPVYTQHIETQMLYKRHLSLEAYDMAAYLQQKTPLQLWKVNVQSMGQSNDLRLTLPYMITAMLPYIGTNTGHMVKVEVAEDNMLLKELLLGDPSRLSPVVPQSSAPPSR